MRGRASLAPSWRRPRQRGAVATTAYAPDGHTAPARRTAHPRSGGHWPGSAPSAVVVKNSGRRISIVTDTIETFTEHGIRVSSGEEIPADIVVTATGFNLSVLDDVAFTVDG